MEAGTKVIFTFNDRDTCETITCSGVFLQYQAGSTALYFEITEVKTQNYRFSPCILRNTPNFSEGDFKLHCIEIDNCVQNIEHDLEFFCFYTEDNEKCILEIQEEEIEAFASWIERENLKTKHAAILSENIAEICAL